LERDLDLLVALSDRAEVWLSITVETDLDPVPGLGRHASPPAARLETLRRFKAAGVRTQATVSPLLPLGDPEAFAADLDAATDRVVLDHVTLGDGSGGVRTRRTPFADLLRAHGFADWLTLDPFHAFADRLRARLGPDRVALSAEGFNAVGAYPPSP
jgi:hypothetical protein